MACYHTLRAFQMKTGTPVFFTHKKGARQVDLPCGQCIGCRLEQSRQKAVRSTHEASLYNENCFVTLTYNDNNIDEKLSLQPKHYTDFMKRIRENVSRKENKKIRYMMCGEYGELTCRPHFHAIIYNWEPHDCKPYKKSAGGHQIYQSEYLNQLWGHGNAYIGTVTFESAGYIARYCTKAKANEKEQEIIDIETGEVYTRINTYGKQSTHPGLGAEWVKKYATDIYPHDRVIINGKQAPIPRYYNKILERESPLYYEENRANRKQKADKKYKKIQDQFIQEGGNKYADPLRLKTEEIVKKAQIKSLRRNNDV